MEQYRLQIEHMTKTFPGVKALDDVQLAVKPGSVHFLIGENGAGKSTLMKCLYGLYNPDGGTIRLDGEEVRIPNTLTALKLGIAMIPQEMNPALDQTVTENIWMNRYATKHLVVDEKEMYNRTKQLLKSMDFDIDPNVKARELSISNMQAMEIVKAISMDARVIIMDEPTSSLTSAETEHLFKLVEKLKSEGRAVIYISHKLEEIHQISDEVTVMRDGKYIGTWPVDEISLDEIVHHMVGRELDERFPAQNKEPEDETILEVRHLTSADPHSFQDISFDLRKGEILGIGGLVGAQRTELVESIFGLRPVASGEIRIKNEKITIKRPKDAIAHKIFLLTEDRRAQGIIPMLSVFDNTLAACFSKFSNAIGVVKQKACQNVVKESFDRISVKTPSMATPIASLSGGNQQKVLVCRAMTTDSHIMIFDEPTRGIDVGAKYEIYKIMRNFAENGGAIIMVSSEMPELLGMSDRVMVMCEGRKTGMFNKEETSQVEIMKYATKTDKEEK